MFSYEVLAELSEVLLLEGFGLRCNDSGCVGLLGLEVFSVSILLLGSVEAWF